MTEHGSALIAFQGSKIDDDIARLVSDPRVSGATFYTPLNIESPAQTRELTRSLVVVAGRPLLIAIDQEGGQLVAGGPGTTQFAGNMALGAINDPDLTERVGAAIGTELRAIGVNVNLAPVADVATRPHNPSMGIRSFGEDAFLVATHTAALTRGLQSQGVAATLKHFPGKGEADRDPHYGLPVLDAAMDRLEKVEFPPFRSGIAAGAWLLMVGHYGLPAVTGDRVTPTSVSPQVMRDLVRGALGFDGLIVTDALDMGGFGDRNPDAPLDAGADLIMYGPAQTGSLPDTPPALSPRLDRIHTWLGSFPMPDLSVVGCREHQDLAARVAERAITLVRDEPGLLPLRIGPEDRVLAVMPQPADLTPADTSSYVTPGLAHALRRHHSHVTELVTAFEPTRDEIAHVKDEAGDHDIVVIGTIAANEGQAALVDVALDSGAKVVTVAMRTPYDLARYPRASTHVCSYGILPPSMDALADALFGAPMTGRLPAAIPGMFPVGHGLLR